MRKFLLCCMLMGACFFCQLSAQSLYKVDIEEKVANSSLIVEGKVLEQYSFWNARHTMIYTSNKIEVTKVFKGQASAGTIEVLTIGGSVGKNHIEASDLLTLEKEQIGVFFCFPNEINLRAPSSGKVLFDVYSSSQGFLSYDLSSQNASAPFADYKITQELYPLLQAKTGRSFTNLKPSFIVDDTKFQNRVNAPTVDAFTPDTVNAGALLSPLKNLITITGTGFGTPSGSAAILFDDANNGTGGTAYPVPYNDPLIVSWTDTEIKVRAPSRAGTGYFQVRDAGGLTGFSPAPLNVFYSILTPTFFGTTVKESNLMNRNGAGGYTVVYSTAIGGSGTDFDASAAKPTFQRALTTWNQVSGFNVIEGGTTFTQVIADDNENVVMYDNANTGQPRLSAGVLAVCYSFNTICSDDLVNFQAQKTGFEIVVRSSYSLGATSFTVGPCPPTSSNESNIDLETVILHELGHALNLGHINDTYQGFSVGEINPGKLMNFAVLNGVKRVSPDFSAKEGAAYAIAPQGNTYGTCNGVVTEMIPLPTILEPKDECPGNFPVSITPRNTIVNFDLVHATSNKFVDPVYDRVKCDGTGAAQTNNAWYAIKTNSMTGGTLTIGVSGYTTVPGALTSCTEAYPGIPVTGVRLSVYAVGSCPQPFLFPSPSACRTITGNGVLAPIPVTANTNYLIYVEGIENTKANFNLTLGGFVLPVTLKDFSGKVLAGHNLLSWNAEAISGIDKMILQKSNDGIHFFDLASFSSSRMMEQGDYKDAQPFARSFYRLLFKNTNGSVDYSSIVLLQREVKNSFTVYPNPVKDAVTVQLNGAALATYTLKLYNTTGQVVYSTVLKAGSRQLQIPVQGLPKGHYQLVAGSQDSIAEVHKIIVE